MLDRSQDKFTFFLEAYEKGWGEDMKDWPQYRFVSIPIYKLFGGNNHPLISVPASFVGSDYLLHNLAGKVICNSLYAFFGEPYSFDDFFQPFWPTAILFFACSLPIAFNKYHKNKQYQLLETNVGNFYIKKDLNGIEEEIVNDTNLITNLRMLQGKRQLREMNREWAQRQDRFFKPERTEKKAKAISIKKKKPKEPLEMTDEELAQGAFGKAYVFSKTNKKY